MGGFEAVQGSYSRSEFFRLGYTEQGFDWQGLKEPIRKYCDDNRVNAVLTAFAAYSGDFATGTHQRISGAGFIGGFRGAALHLVTMIGLADCQSTNIVAARGLAPLRDGSRGQVLKASPAVAVPKNLAKTELNQLSEQQLATIKMNLIEMPRHSWGPTLSAIFGR